MKETALAPRYLELALTQSVVMHDAEFSSVLEALKAGCNDRPHWHSHP